MAEAREWALYLHNSIKGNIRHPVFPKHIPKIIPLLGFNFFELNTYDLIMECYNFIEETLGTSTIDLITEQLNQQIDLIAEGLNLIREQLNI